MGAGAPLRLLIAADGGAAVGAGHQVRCGCLAAAALAAGHEALLVTQNRPGSAHAWAWRGLPARILSDDRSPVSAWSSMFDEEAYDAVIVDHYALDAPQFQTLAERLPVVVIDDVPGRDLRAASLVVNQNLGIGPERYPVPAVTGPRYAMLRAPFAQQRWRGQADGRVALVMGGTDAAGVVPRLLEALRAGGLPVDAIGVEHALPQVRSHPAASAETVAELLAGARAAVLAAGSAVYEALAVGVPFVALVVADNQRVVADGLRAGGLAPVVDIRAGEWDPAQVVEQLATLTPPAPEIVDGAGAQRVVEAIERCVRESS